MDNNSRIIPTYIEDEMKSSYMEYAMSVIISRALPDVRDGLKPVHRRVLYGMQGLGVHYNKSFKKCARIVGEVMGKYHPHGDSSIYDALVRLAQPWSMRYELVDGQGNFGSVDGDSPAAMRYTEARMKRISELMIQDLEKDTCDFVPNFDESESEPVVLPAAVPNLLINGSTGIAVGMATNIPPHNLNEVIDATCALIENRDLEPLDLMEYMQGPDFPTGGIIVGRRGIVEAFKSGRGKVIVRAKTNIEKKKNGREVIIVNEIPYMVNKGNLIEKMADLVKAKTIEGISEIRDESDRDGLRIVIELKRDAYAEVILNQLFKYTMLQNTFGINILALVKNEPKVLDIKSCLTNYIDHRHEIVVRRTKFDLIKAEKRAHILEGLRIALDNIDAVIETIKKSKDAAEAKIALVDKFELSEIQASAILEMRLQRLTGLERDKIENEYKELMKLIEELRYILATESKRMEIIRDELLAAKEKFGDPRRTEIIEDENDFSIEDMIADEEVAITISHAGYIKRQEIDEYRMQARGGVGKQGATTKDEDFIQNFFIASTHNYILFFTNKGRVHWLKVFMIPPGGRLSRGKAIVNMLNLAPGEIVKSYVCVKSFEGEDAEKSYIVMATKQGVVNKQPLSSFSNVRKGGINAIRLDEGDDLIAVSLSNGENDIVLGTKKGLAVRFHESGVRELGRNTRGVKGVNLSKVDSVISMVIIDKPTTLLTVCEKGYGKRTNIDEYRITKRGAKGIINIKCSERNGDVIVLTAVEDHDNIMLITKSGIVIRQAVDGVNTIGRNTQGVRLIRLKNDDDAVIDVCPVYTGDKDETEDSENSETSIDVNSEVVDEKKVEGVENNSEENNSDSAPEIENE